VVLHVIARIESMLLMVAGLHIHVVLHMMFLMVVLYVLWPSSNRLGTCFNRHQPWLGGKVLPVGL
jgi:hypothetical protein